jgi:hypothetical protein
MSSSQVYKRNYFYFTVYNCEFAAKSLRFWLPQILLQSFKPTDFQTFCGYNFLPIL